MYMSSAAEIPWTPQDSPADLHSLFATAPFALAQCQRAGNITALNPALEHMLGGRSRIARSLCFADLIHPQDRAEAKRLLSELFDRQRDSFQMDSQTTGANSRPVRWTAWRVPGTNGNADYALASAEAAPRSRDAEQRLRQAQRLEAVGRLAGGVAHDFNNLLTGVLLYCDLLIANLEPCHRVRKYAEEIRNAGIQATGLVRQLLAVARPANSESRLFSLNEIAEGMRNLLVRLIGENIELKFHLDPSLGLVKMDPAQCQQILLNLVLNARDALSESMSEATPGGGQITVETRNCKVQILTEQVLPESHSATAGRALLPCALFVVADNGSGMDAVTRTHLFEAFFTTKTGKGTGLGLATVYDIVTGNGGLIHVESAPACGTRVSVLLPLVPEAVLKSAVAHSVAGSEPQSDFASHNFANHNLANHDVDDHDVGHHDFQLARNPEVPLAKELKEKE
jgi:two-component system cell cycle sensor histidine kinase/response regulator CckA